MTISKVYSLFNYKVHGTPVERYIGKYGDIFYNPDVGELRLSDGVTPGGVSPSDGSEPQIWVAEADSTYNVSNTQAIGYDSDGNLFSLMYQGPYTGSNTVASIAKFSPIGNIIWTKDLKTGTSVNPWSLAVDHQNNLYVIVQQSNSGVYNNTVVKMNGQDGTIIWQYDIQNTQNSNNMQALPVFADGFTGVAVIGTEYNSGTNNFFLGLITEDGSSYEVTDLGNGWNESAYGAAVNVNGDIVIAGITQSSGPLYMEVVKLSIGDGTSWQNSYTVDENYDLQATDITWSSYDNTWVVVGTHSAANNIQGMVVAKLSDTDGSCIWAHEVSNGCVNISSSVASDANGNVYITGSTFSGKTIQNGAPGIWRVIGAYDVNGNKIWQKYFLGNDSSWVVDNNWWNGIGYTGKVIAVYNNYMAIGALSANWVGEDITTQVGIVTQFPTLGADQSIGFYELRQSFLSDSPISLEVNGIEYSFTESASTLVASTTMTSSTSNLTYYVNHAGNTLNKLINGGQSVILGPDGVTSFPGDVVDPIGNVRSIPKSSVINDVSYSLLPTDNGQFLYGANSTIVIPTEDDTVIDVGFTATIVSNETGNLYISTSNSSVVRILVPGLAYATSYTMAPASMATLLKVDLNTWYLSGATITTGS